MESPSFKAFFAVFLYTNIALFTSVSPSSANQGANVPPLGQAEETFQIGPWVGAKQFLQDGTFFSCLMVADYGEGRSTAFGINNDYQFWFGLSSQSWQFSRGKEYAVSYTIDRSSQVTLSASAPFPNMLMADFVDASKAFSQLKNAKLLTVRIPALNETVQVQLNSAGSALTALADCVNDNTKNAPERNAGDEFNSLKKEI